MSLPNTIAVDGPAGSGKSSVAFVVAQRIGYLYVDTGAFYRAVTFLALERELSVDDSQAMAALSQTAQLDMIPVLGEGLRPYTLLADGEDITTRIHSPLIDSRVSAVAANPSVRDALLETQRKVARRGRAMLVGRDIGTVVLPDADLKIYLDASLEVRARRRYDERITKGETADLATIQEAMRVRDQQDSSRKTAPLLRAPDAVYLDTSDLSLEDAIEALYQIVTQHLSITTKG